MIDEKNKKEVTVFAPKAREVALVASKVSLKWNCIIYKVFSNIVFTCWLLTTTLRGEWDRYYCLCVVDDGTVAQGKRLAPRHGTSGSQSQEAKTRLSPPDLEFLSTEPWFLSRHMQSSITVKEKS